MCSHALASRRPDVAGLSGSLCVHTLEWTGARVFTRQQRQGTNSNRVQRNPFQCSILFIPFQGLSASEVQLGLAITPDCTAQTARSWVQCPRPGPRHKKLRCINKRHTCPFKCYVHIFHVSVHNTWDLSSSTTQISPAGRPRRCPQTQTRHAEPTTKTSSHPQAKPGFNLAVPRYPSRWARR